MELQKKGFCVENTNRVINSRHSPIYSNYSCIHQGVDSGWADNYNGGIPCQWVDLTAVDNTVAETRLLTLETNPLRVLCEGHPEPAPNDFPPWQWEYSGYNTTAPPWSTDNAMIDKIKCTNADEAPYLNNIDTISVTVPVMGDGQLTGPCDHFGMNGPKRNCEFHYHGHAALAECTPGDTVILMCSLQNPADSKAQVLRLCEASRVLGSGLPCPYTPELNVIVPPDSEAAFYNPRMLANVVIEGASPVPVSFICPPARDAEETGGYFSFYSGPVLTLDAHAAIQCEPLVDVLKK